MKFLRHLLYLLAILVLQTVIFSRLPFFGSYPDLILIATVAFSLIYPREKALLFSAAGGFLQDVLSSGWYLNTSIKILICLATILIKENFFGNEESLLIGLVPLFTAVTLLLEGGLFFLLGKNISFLALFGLVVLSSLYNLILTPILLATLKTCSK